jgi:aquaporin Z
MWWQQTEQSEPGGPAPTILQCLLAEGLGTFFLTFADSGVGLAAKLSTETVSLAARAITPGLVVLAMIFALGELSGAHINPAVTLGFAARGAFPWKRVPLYWIFQAGGALLAALVLRGIFSNVGELGGTKPLIADTPAFLLETVLSFTLVTVILATSHQHKIKGPKGAYPVASTVAACGLVGKGLSGASMNPARSLGPALVSGTTRYLPLYLIAPLLGSLLAVIAVRVVHGPAKAKDEEAARGEKNSPA